MEGRTDLDVLDRNLEHARERLAELQRRALDRPASSDLLLDTAFHEFSTALEELSVAESELRTQNDVLIETRAEVEEARIRYQELFELAPDAYLVTDHFGNIREANRAAFDLFRLRVPPAARRPISGLVPMSRRRSFRVWLNRFVNQSSEFGELSLPMLTRDGQTFDAEIRVAASRQSLGPRILRWIIRDVGERKRLEDEVRRANAELEQRVAERTAALAAANELKDRLLLGERAARERAEDLRRESAFLAEAGVILGESLDVDVTLDSLAKLLTQQFADWCRVYLVDDGQLRTAAAAHRLNEKSGLIRAMIRHEVGDGFDKGPRRVVETGEPIYIRELTEDDLRRAADDEEHLAILRQLGPKSAILVPMVARGERVGVIALALANGRRFEESDLGFAMELARRAGVAVDNARLYRLAQEQIAEREKAEALANELNTQLKRAMTETHHRVKNNLQLITAMIDMRLLDESDTITADDMRRLANQISILARVHDLLTTTPQRDSQERVPVEPVIDALLAMLRRAAGGRRVDYRVDEMELPSRQLSALALVVNELVSNALKHSGGHVEVEISMAEDGPHPHVVAEIFDDGPGFPDGFNAAREASTGLELVQTLSRWDLGGTVEFTNREEGGARVVVTFPVAG